jgi:mRNA interferase HicA
MLYRVGPIKSPSPVPCSTSGPPGAPRGSSLGFVPSSIAQGNDDLTLAADPENRRSHKWSLSNGQKCPIIAQTHGETDNKNLKAMRGNELIKKVETLGKERGITVRLDKKRGKGSHQTLYFGERKTIIRNPKDELKTGTDHAMLKQLGISEKDLK